MKKSVVCRVGVIAIAIALVCTAVSGCASPPLRAYDGPERLSSQVAKIFVDDRTPPPAYSGRTSDKATIRLLDRQDLKGSALSGYPKEIIVMPGQHEILARVAGSGNAALGALGSTLTANATENAVKKWDAPMTFDAIAGKSYRIRYEFVKGPESPEKEDYFNRNKGKLWVYWIEDADTGQYVCGWEPDDFAR